MICSNCTQRLPVGSAPVSVRVEPHEYPMCSLLCMHEWAVRLKPSRQPFVAPKPEPRPWLESVPAAAPAPEPVKIAAKAVAAAPGSTRSEKIRAFWAALTPEERAVRTAKARAALAKRQAGARR